MFRSKSQLKKVYRLSTEQREWDKMANIALSGDKGHMFYVDMNNNVCKKGKNRKIRIMLMSAIIVVKICLVP